VINLPVVVLRNNSPGPVQMYLVFQNRNYGMAFVDMLRKKNFGAATQLQWHNTTQHHTSDYGATINQPSFAAENTTFNAAFNSTTTKKERQSAS
jgi:hypothetical protein